MINSVTKRNVRTKKSNLREKIVYRFLLVRNNKNSNRKLFAILFQFVAD